MQLLEKLSKIFIDTPYDTMRYRYRQLHFIFGIASATLYLVFAIIRLTTKNPAGDFTYWLIISLTVLTGIIILSLFRMNTTKQRYSKKNYALISKTLKRTVKLLVLIIPLTVLLKDKSFGTGLDFWLKVYSLIHVTIIVVMFIVSLIKLYYRFSRRRKYREKEKENRKSKMERFVLTTQEVLKYIIYNKSEEALNKPDERDFGFDNSTHTKTKK